MGVSNQDRRKHTRYEIGPEEPVYCRFNRLGSCNRWLPVTVRNESAVGCSLILNDSGEVDIGETIHLDFGHGHSTEAEVVRVDRLSAGVVQLGCRLLF